MYIFVFGVIGTIITFSVVAPLTYLANKNNMFYFTFYDNRSISDIHHNSASALAHAPSQNASLPMVAEKANLSSHLLLNTYMLSDANAAQHSSIVNNGFNSSLPEESLLHWANSDYIINNNNKSLSVANKTSKDTTEDNYSKYSVINFSVKDILLFSAVISATDTVAALTFIKEDKDPKLFAILFGEGVLNDAVCIVLYRIIKEFTDSNEGILFYFVKLN